MAVPRSGAPLRGRCGGPGSRTRRWSGAAHCQRGHLGHSEAKRDRQQQEQARQHWSESLEQQGQAEGGRGQQHQRQRPEHHPGPDGEELPLDPVAVVIAGPLHPVVEEAADAQRQVQRDRHPPHPRLDPTRPAAVAHHHGAHRGGEQHRRPDLSVGDVHDVRVRPGQQRRQQVDRRTRPGREQRVLPVPAPRPRSAPGPAHAADRPPAPPTPSPTPLTDHPWCPSSLVDIRPPPVGMCRPSVGSDRPPGRQPQDGTWSPPVG